MSCHRQGRLSKAIAGRLRTRAEGMAKITHDRGGDTATRHQTLQCCHCGRVWVMRPGSGKRRGWCMQCSAVTCGNDRCDACVPLLQQLDNMERGRDLLFRPVCASVPRSVS